MLKPTSRLRYVRSVLLLFLPLLLLSLTILKAVSASGGNLDPTFGSGGKVRTDFFGSFDGAYAVAAQPDGKIVAAGSASDSASSGFALARYNGDGSLDASFGSGGRVLAKFYGNGDGASSVAIQADGKIVAAGYTQIVNHSDFALARFNPNGSFDASFGSGGMVTTDIDGEDSANALVIQPDQKILVAGTSLARYNPDGSLDQSFGVGGKLVLGYGSSLSALVIQSDGKIIGAGAITEGENQQFLVMRFNSGSTLDSSFGSGGKVITDFYNDTDAALSVALQADGRIIVGGYAYGGPDSYISFALARYSSNGSLDPSFGSGGKVTSGLGLNLYALYIQPDGKIVAAGNADTTEDTYRFEFALVRFNQSGSLDTGFGQGGRVTTNFASPQESLNYQYQSVSGLAAQPGGRLVAVGTFFTGETSDFVLARYDLGLSLYDSCIQDESNGNILQLNTTTGEYQFTNCAGLTIGGAGTLTRRGSLITLQHNGSDRRVMATVDTAAGKAIAIVQLLSQGATFSITDKSIGNNTCACR